MIAPLLIAVLFIAGCGTDSVETPVPEIEGPVVTVLGSAQDGGLPHAGCYCDRCERARLDPTYARLVASLGIVFPKEGSRYLIDATPDVRPQLDRLREAGPIPPQTGIRHPIDGVLLTHAHIGHYTGLIFFGYESMHTRSVPVTCTPKMWEFLATNAPWDQLVRLENIVQQVVHPGEPFRLHDRLEVTAIKVPHRDEYADTVGYLLRGPERTLFYVPDTDSWEKWEIPLLDHLQGVDIAILDGTFYSMDELPGRDISSVSHPLISRSMDLLEPLVRSGKLQVYFTHMNHSNLALDPEGEAVREVRQRGFHIIEDGWEFHL